MDPQEPLVRLPVEVAATAPPVNSTSMSSSNAVTGATSNHGEKPRVRRPYSSKKAQNAAMRARSPRAACDFCHNKRVKCVTLQGQPRCEQCTQRDTDCIFSLKGKTGPKPKTEQEKREAAMAKEAREAKEKNEGKLRKESPKKKKKPSSAKVPVSLLPAPGEQHSESQKHQLGNTPSPEPSSQPSSTAAAASKPFVRCPERERIFLEAYINTVGQFVPVVHEDALRYALRERQRLPAAMAAARGIGRIALEQAEVAGAMAIGALIKGDMQAGDVYRVALDFHLSGITSNVEPKAAPALGLMALYWQHLGDDQLKLHWLAYLRGSLGNGHVSGDLVLCIQYLDYAVEARPRPGVSSLTATRRSLHTVSCLLSYMPNIINPSGGQAIAVAFCDDLGTCLRALQNDTHAEVAKLLCKSLRALLLVMLGRGDRAMILLQSIPMLIQRSEGGNPDAMRALPLSWDALLISGALTFLLGQLPTYRRIRAAVVTSVNTLPPEARWSYCLPNPDSDPEAYIDHLCDSSSNICSIVCSIAAKTSFGQLPFYSDDHGQGHHFQQEDEDFVPPSWPSLPLGGGDLDDESGAGAGGAGGAGAGQSPSGTPSNGGLSGSPETEAQSAADERSYGYGAGGMAMRAPPHQWGARAGSGGGTVGYGSGGTVACADGGGNARNEGGGGGDGVVSDNPNKRRRTKSAQSLGLGEVVDFVERGGGGGEEV